MVLNGSCACGYVKYEADRMFPLPPKFLINARLTVHSRAQDEDHLPLHPLPEVDVAVVESTSLDGNHLWHSLGLAIDAGATLGAEVGAVLLG